MNQDTGEYTKLSKRTRLRVSTDQELSDVKEKSSTSLSDSTEDNNKKTKQSSDVKSSYSNTNNTVLVVKHYDSLKNKNIYVRSESCILYMRNFNNWIKSILLMEFNLKSKASHNDRGHVLDLCCGKGGDLQKWRAGNIAHLICADVAEVALQHCQDRYNQLLNRYGRIFTAEFILADCTKVRLKEKYKDPSTSFDMVSCQFAFHYCFESLPQVEYMLKNASECLKTGGYFVGTLPDAYSLVWQRCNGNSFGNDIYNIEFFCDKAKPPIFGAKYHFQLEDVVNCPEYLVYLPVLRKLALKFGLQLVLFERFDRFYECRRDKNKSILYKINALETFPPRRGVKLNGKAENDYEHAKNYMRNSSARQIGTLSQSEWEIISLYAVFAFKKVKSVE